jgi:hypothetical protein
VLNNKNNGYCCPPILGINFSTGIIVVVSVKSIPKTSSYFQNILSSDKYLFKIYENMKLSHCSTPNSHWQTLQTLQTQRDARRSFRPTWALRHPWFVQQAKDSDRRCEITAEGCEITSEGCEITAEGCELTAEGCEITAEGCELTAERCDITAEGCEITAEEYRWLP